MLPGHLQQIDRAQGVDFEIQERNFPRFVVRRLCRAMHNQVESLRAEEFFDGRAIANINGSVREPLGGVLQPLQVPERVARGAKKHSPHIVVYAEDFVPLAVEMLDRLGADESAAAGNENFHRAASLSKKARQAGRSECGQARRRFRLVACPRSFASIRVLRISSTRSAGKATRFALYVLRCVEIGCRLRFAVSANQQ